ncbi:MAG TPA: hypothetical protein VFK50_04865 [Sphingomicrobium sp.]|nr:hypothetical protein [Sphingomicrobium sp.]
MPRRTGFAGAQADDRILVANRLPRPQGQVANDPVALVEQADDGDPLGHRGNARLAGDRCPRDVDCDRLALFRLFIPIAAGKQRDRDEGDSGGAHDYSGIQG